MSKINENISNYNYGKSSKIIIISKSRLSSAKAASNYMTFIEGNKKIIYELGKENISKTKLKKTFSTLKETILKYSNSADKLKPENNKNNIHPKKKNKITISINSENNEFNVNKEHNIRTIETCNGLITNTNNNQKEDIDIIDNNISIDSNNKRNKIEILDSNNNNQDKNIEKEEDDSIDFNLQGIKIVNIEQIYKDSTTNNKNNNRNLISQNYFKNIKISRNKEEYPYNIHKSEEIQKTLKQSDKAVKSISDHISKINDNIQIISSERSENKKSTILNINRNNINNLITEERQLNNEVKEKEEDIYNKFEKNKISKNLINIKKIEDEDYYNCSICEYSCLESKMFLPECNIHYICKRCTRNYYEDIIDDGIKELFCPFLQCKRKVNFDKLKSFISSNHYARISQPFVNTENLEENKIILSKIKSDYNIQDIERYSKRHVIDVNSNKILYNYKGINEKFCPFCNELTLFTQTNNHFYKCLNCLTKVCKYCFKEYNITHFDMSNPNNCKVFHRFDEVNLNKRNKFLLFLLEIFFVIASYYLTFIGIFICLRDCFFIIFNINKKANCFKHIFSYCFSIIIFILIIPFIIIIFPFFPFISAIFDF